MENDARGIPYRRSQEGWRQLKLIAGVELSCDWNGLEIHVVGLLKELRTPTLDALLSEQQNNRRQRAEAIAVKLDAVGATGARDYLAALPATALTRSHIADFLVASGICKNKQKRRLNPILAGAEKRMLQLFGQASIRRLAQFRPQVV